MELFLVLLEFVGNCLNGLLVYLWLTDDEED